MRKSNLMFGVFWASLQAANSCKLSAHGIYFDAFGSTRTAFKLKTSHNALLRSCKYSRVSSHPEYLRKVEHNAQLTQRNVIENRKQSHVAVRTFFLFSNLARGRAHYVSTVNSAMCFDSTQFFGRST